MEMKKFVLRECSDHNFNLWQREVPGKLTFKETVRKVHLKLLLSSLTRSSTAATLPDLNAVRNQRAEELIGPVHTGQPSGMLSGWKKGREEISRGQGMLHKGR